MGADNPSNAITDLKGRTFSQPDLVNLNVDNKIYWYIFHQGKIHQIKFSKLVPNVELNPG